MDKNKQGVSGVLVRTNNKVLLCQRSMDSTLPGLWSVPGGHIEKGENPKTAALREFLEETNLELSSDTLQYMTKLPVETAEQKPFYLFLYDTEEELYPDLENASHGEEHTRCKYFSKTNIPTTTSSLEKVIQVVLK